jgi:hypothetical protein
MWLGIANLLFGWRDEMWLGQLGPPVICLLDQRMDKNMAKDSFWRQFVAAPLMPRAARVSQRGRAARFSRPPATPPASSGLRPLTSAAAGRAYSLLPAAPTPCRRPRLLPVAGRAYSRRRPRLLPVAGRVARPTVAGHVARVNSLSFEGFAENDSGESQQWLSISANFGRMASTIFSENIP